VETFSSHHYVIEKLEVSTISDGTMLWARGVVRNTTNRHISGHLIAHFLDASGAVVNSGEYQLRDRSGVSAKTSAVFEFYYNTELSPSISNVRIEFVEK